MGHPIILFPSIDGQAVANSKLGLALLLYTYIQVIHRIIFANVVSITLLTISSQLTRCLYESFGNTFDFFLACIVVFAAYWRKARRLLLRCHGNGTGWTARRAHHHLICPNPSDDLRRSLVPHEDVDEVGHSVPLD
jgi:hypothetical protein